MRLVGRIVFVAAVILLVATRLIVSSDLAVEIVYGPHDDWLYVRRALQLMVDGTLGPYDSLVLVKFPGVSLWLAGLRLLGIPFLIGVTGLYVVAGLYLLSAFIRCGTNIWVALAAFALYLFNPITFSFDWLRVFREATDTELLVVMVAAMGHILLDIGSDKRPWIHVAVFSVAFAFSLFMREENRLLWALLLLFCAALIYRMRGRTRDRMAISIAALTIVLPALVGKGYELLLREFVEDRYGLPIIHDFSEGEFPRMLAAIRSVVNSKENRLVMVSQETLAKLKKEVPAFTPVAERLPAPGPRTYSCEYHGVCSEWSNGWMLFWVKDEAFQAGLTPNLKAAQAYFQRVRIDIERACEQGRLKCAHRGDGLLPPMELRWTRAYIAETWRLIKMTLVPSQDVVPTSPLVYDVPLEVGRAFQVATMTHNFDTEYQASAGANAPHILKTSFYTTRSTLKTLYRYFGPFLLLLALGAFFTRISLCAGVSLSPLALLGGIFAMYAVLRLLVLGYVAVFFGQFTDRIVFSIYGIAIALSLPYIAETATACRTAHRGLSE
jgi:hypothetical protein